MKQFKILAGPSHPDLIRAERLGTQVSFKITHRPNSFTLMAGEVSELSKNSSGTLKMKVTNPLIKSVVSTYDPVKQAGSGYQVIQPDMRDKLS